jgi:hypothetical protein
MVKTACSKALAKSRQNRLRYVLQMQMKQKNRIRWNIIRAIFYFFVLYYKSRNKKVNEDIQCNLVECPISVIYFLNKNNSLQNHTDFDTTSVFSDEYEILGNHEETDITTDNIVSVPTHAENFCIVKDVLDSLCKKVSKLVSSSNFAKTKYRICLEERERKKLHERYLYRVNNVKRMKRLTNKIKLYHENKN